jgi:hypothetical protein
LGSIAIVDDASASAYSRRPFVAAFAMTSRSAFHFFAPRRAARSGDDDVYARSRCSGAFYTSASGWS